MFGDLSVSGVVKTVAHKFMGSAGSKGAMVIAWEHNYACGQIVFDCVVSEAHQATCDVTNYPVESGFIISDHTIRRNRVLNVHGAIVNAKLSQGLVPATIKVAGAVFGSKLAGVVATAYNTFNSLAGLLGTTESSPVSKGFKELQNLVNNGAICHVSTLLGEYSPCVVRSMQVVQDVESSNYLNVKLVIEELVLVNRLGETSLNANDEAVMITDAPAAGAVEQGASVGGSLTDKVSGAANSTVTFLKDATVKLNQEIEVLQKGALDKLDVYDKKAGQYISDKLGDK